MEKIPEQISFDGLKIVLYGPESTGKSTLAQQLSDYYQTVKVNEFARDYLQEKLNTSGAVCQYEDILPIAIGQRNDENRAARLANQILICDTDAVETYVYSMVYFEKAPVELEKAARKSDYDLYLLMDVDIPWCPDDLRDKPKEREFMFEQFEKTLKSFNKPYVLISGSGKKRFNNALNAIEKLKNK